MSSGVFVGLDINRNSVQVAARPVGKQWTGTTDDSEVIHIANELASVEPEIIVLEAQGGVELRVAGTLATTGLPLAFVSRRSVREFAKSIGQGAKDRNHAELLAHFAELVRPEVRPLPTTVLEQLQGLKARQQEIMDMLQLERSRQDVEVVPVQRNVRSHIHFLERSLALLNEEVNQTVRSSSIWR
jgi:transposase